MTEGLQKLAGRAVRAALMRFTHSPLSGAMTGAASTAVLQSSSATTVAAVGFVGAGLLSFPAALGIIFGANIGTTFRGWLVALLGFKLQIGTIALGIVLIGAILRLFAKHRLSDTGYAIAGFGLIFVGVSELQQAMAGLEGIITPDHLPDDTLSGRVLLVMLGIAITAITQSSSTGVAAALTALYAGAISFEQAAALIIGMDIGTTITAAMATIGATVDARRTGYSHVIYNLFTGTAAIFLITPYIFIWQSISPGALYAEPEIALVAFHTSFNILGVIIVLPFTSRFARMIQKLVPEKRPIYTRRLDEGLLADASLALSAAQDSTRTEFIVLLGHINAVLSGNGDKQRVDLAELQTALDQTHSYVDSIHMESHEGADWQRLLALSHTLDHLQRLHERCEEDEDRAITARENEELSAINSMLISTIVDVINNIDNKQWQQASLLAKKTAAQIHDQVEPLREAIIEKMAHDKIDATIATDQLEAIRWLQRVSEHIARISHHSQQAIVAAGNQNQLPASSIE